MTTVRNTQEFQAALSAGVDPKTIRVGYAGNDDVTSRARMAERTRCLEIYRLAGKNHPAMAARAIDSGMSVEALGLELFKQERRAEQEQTTVQAITKRWDEGKPNNEGATQRGPVTVTDITNGFQKR